jgi:hypothetical protein
MAIETWKTIPSYPSYMASTLGNIQKVENKKGYSTKPLRKGFSKKTGYQHVVLFIDGQRFTNLVHSLVAETFIGTRPTGLDVNHINTIKTDNRSKNLEYLTRKENIAHAVMWGIHSHGEKHGMSKLTDADVLNIKERIKAGDQQNLIAQDFNIDPSRVSKIKHGKLWKHVQTGGLK